MSDKVNVYTLSWNPITVEGYNESKNEIIMVFNCDIRTEEKCENIIKYVVGRTVWGCNNFPDRAIVTLSFDIRGQGIILSKSSMFKSKLLEGFRKLEFDNKIFIDFLR